MRILAIDVGSRRVGLAISDPTGTLARPLTTIVVRADTGIDAVVQEIARLSAEDDGLERLVVGLPVGLNGSDTGQTAYVRMFIDALKARTSLPVDVEDERLTSREAESLLALRERDWRKRKERLDAAAAAVILQDYLDRRQESR
jgi:putative Holliday junction resolvase